MITNIPTEENYSVLGSECLVKSIEMLITLSRDLQNINEELEEETLEWKEFWEYHHINLRASLILAYSGVEYLMKSRIARQSALLLIQNPKTEWPSLPGNRSKSFNQMQTISGEQLLTVFFAVANEEYKDTTYRNDFEKLRIARNEIVHSASSTSITVKYILESSIEFITFFFGPYTWRDLLYSQLENSPLYDLFDSDLQKAHNFHILNFLKREIGTNKFNSYNELNIKARKYFCPYCTYHLSQYDAEGEFTKWAFLMPNKPNSVAIKCLSCNQLFDVEREDCLETNCKGNVINSDFRDPICLTCNCNQ